MRLSREAKAQHHEAITSAASKMLRERGIERTSVIDLMQAVGLTHGGFYRHFKSKDELVARRHRRPSKKSFNNSRKERRKPDLRLRSSPMCSNTCPICTAMIPLWAA